MSGVAAEALCVAGGVDEIAALADEVLDLDDVLGASQRELAGVCEGESTDFEKR